jgi:hypothetical protein
VTGNLKGSTIVECAFQNDRQAPETDNPFKGLLTIFYSPAVTFRHFGKRAWLVALVASSAVLLLTNLVIVRKIGIGTVIRNQLEFNTSLARRLPPAQIEELVQRAENNLFQRMLIYAENPIEALLKLFILAIISWACLRLIRGRTSIGAVFTALTWANYVVSVVFAIGALIVVYTRKDASAIDPAHIFGLTPAVFAATPPSPTDALLSAFDLTAFWAIFLQIVGVTALSKRVSSSQAAAVFGGIYILTTVVKVWVSGHI